jgi:hypothetical protein
MMVSVYATILKGPSGYPGSMAGRDRRVTQVGGGAGLVPRLRRSDCLGDRFPALPGWAEVLTAGPPGLASIAIFAASFLP